MDDECIWSCLLGSILWDFISGGLERDRNLHTRDNICFLTICILIIYREPPFPLLFFRGLVLFFFSPTVSESLEWQCCQIGKNYYFNMWQFHFRQCSRISIELEFPSLTLLWKLLYSWIFNFVMLVKSTITEYNHENST